MNSRRDPSHLRNRRLPLFFYPGLICEDPCKSAAEGFYPPNYYNELVPDNAKPRLTEMVKAAG